MPDFDSLPRDVGPRYLALLEMAKHTLATSDKHVLFPCPGTYKGQSVVVLIDMHQIDGNTTVVIPVAILLTDQEMPDIDIQFGDDEESVRLTSLVSTETIMNGSVEQLLGQSDIILQWCLICGNPINGHIGIVHKACVSSSAAGAAILNQHEHDDHSHCHPNGCQAAADAISSG
jgi:hypothetical protein